MKKSNRGITLVELLVVGGISTALFAVAALAMKSLQKSSKSGGFQSISGGEEAALYEMILSTGRRGKPCRKLTSPGILECDIPKGTAIVTERFSSTTSAADSHTPSSHSHIEFSVNEGSGFQTRRSFAGIENFEVCDEANMRDATHPCRTNLKWTPTKISQRFALLKASPAPVFFRFRFDVVGENARQRSFQGSFFTRNEALERDGSNVTYQARTAK